MGNLCSTDSFDYSSKEIPVVEVVERFKLEDSNQNVCLEIPLERDEESKKAWEYHSEWKSNEKCELLESTTNVRHTLHDDGIDLFYYHLRQNSKPRAVVFTFHGYGSSSRIEASYTANFLAMNDVEVVGFDNEGHGRNEKKEDRCYVESYKHLILNGVSFVEKILEKEKERFEGIPIYLWGMSLGASLVGSILASEEFKATQEKISGAILLAPLVSSPLQPPCLIYEGAKILSCVVPKAEYPEVFDPISTSSWEGNVEWFLNHEDSYAGMRTRMSVELLKLGASLKENAYKITHPILLLHGTNDNICSISGSFDLFESFRSEKKTFIQFFGFLHAIIADRCLIDMTDITLQWLQYRIKDELEKEEEEEEGEEANDGFFHT